jgi:hypothetical protein
VSDLGYALLYGGLFAPIVMLAVWAAFFVRPTTVPGDASPPPSRPGRNPPAPPLYFDSLTACPKCGRSTDEAYVRYEFTHDRLLYRCRCGYAWHEHPEDHPA